MNHLDILQSSATCQADPPGMLVSECFHVMADFDHAQAGIPCGWRFPPIRPANPTILWRIRLE